MLDVTAALLVMIATDRRVSRLEGGVLIADYVIYIAVVIGRIVG